MREINLDAIGFSASAVCAVHCLAVPFLLAGAGGISTLAHPLIELSVITLGLIVGTVSLSHGYRHHHRNAYIPGLLVMGFLVILSGHLFFEELEHLVTPFGAFLVAMSHYWNWRQTKACSHRHHELG